MKNPQNINNYSTERCWVAYQSRPISLAHWKLCGKKARWGSFKHSWHRQCMASMGLF